MEIVKVKETEEMTHKDATEIDMVVNIGKVLSCDWDYISRYQKPGTNIN